MVCAVCVAPAAAMLGAGTSYKGKKSKNAWMIYAGITIIVLAIAAFIYYKYYAPCDECIGEDEDR